MAEAPREISKPKLLIGEGWEEVYFFSALLNRLGLNDIQVEQYGGKAKLSPYLRNLVKAQASTRSLRLELPEMRMIVPPLHLRASSILFAGRPCQYPTTPKLLRTRHESKSLCFPMAKAGGCLRIYVFVRFRQIRELRAWMSTLSAFKGTRSGNRSPCPKHEHTRG